MNLYNLKENLTDAVNEIQRLQRRNEILSAKVEMIDLFACVLHTNATQRTEGASPDVAYFLSKHISEIEDETKPKVE